MLKGVALAAHMAGTLWIIGVVLCGMHENPLLDSGASRSFLAPSLVAEARLVPTGLVNGIKFESDTRVIFEVDSIEEGENFVLNALKVKHNSLVAEVPYRMILWDA